MARLSRQVQRFLKTDQVQRFLKIDTGIITTIIAPMEEQIGSLIVELVTPQISCFK